MHNNIMQKDSTNSTIQKTSSKVLVQHTHKPITDTLEENESPQEQKRFNPFNFYNNPSNSDSSVYSSQKGDFQKLQLSIKKEHHPNIRNTDFVKEKNWVFGMATIVTVLLLIVFIYFNRQLKAVISAFLNIQLSDKLTREKNIMLKRLFWLMNLNFLIAISLYSYIAIQQVFGLYTKWNHFNLFALILTIATVFLLFRYILLLILGYVFDTYPLFKEFLHDSYILYKNLGLYLLPLVLSYFFVPEELKDILFYMATTLLILFILYRYLRSILIILRHKVSYFYTILYLCTLEILPVLVGIKFVLSLR